MKRGKERNKRKLFLYVNHKIPTANFKFLLYLCETTIVLVKNYISVKRTNFMAKNRLVVLLISKWPKHFLDVAEISRTAGYFFFFFL